MSKYTLEEQVIADKIMSETDSTTLATFVAIKFGQMVVSTNAANVVISVDSDFEGKRYTYKMVVTAKPCKKKA